MLKLNNYTRSASLGYDYVELYNDYPMWSYDLHECGNTLSNDKLEQIALQGIIKWYIENNCQFTIDYNYYEKLLLFNDSIYCITYYDTIQLNKLLTHLKMEPIIELNDCLTKTHFLLNNIDKKLIYLYASKQWSDYIIDIIGKLKLTQIIEYLLKYIENNIEWFGCTSFYDIFLQKYPHIKTIGIIFQKFKIVLEKCVIFKPKLLYIIDNFVEKTQQILYSYCTYYVERFNNNNLELIIFENTDLYKNDVLLNPIEIDKIESFLIYMS